MTKARRISFFDYDSNLYHKLEESEPDGKGWQTFTSSDRRNWMEWNPFDFKRIINFFRKNNH